jgi:thiamine pyrophosphate-dependent acetolactate synthase large subunit-like protein
MGEEKIITTYFGTPRAEGLIYAADGYARATGKISVCFATSDPRCY